MLEAWNKKNIKNYVEIYIKSDLKKIIRKGKKKIYHQNKKNVIGLDIKAEYPKNPHIILCVITLKKILKLIHQELMIKIKKHLN